VCGVRFDAIYGPELARGYIEIHHTVSITKLNHKAPNIDDLVPLCANCHRMAHRRRGEIVPIPELKKIIQSHAKKISCSS
jgi:5-methylcytosine-specific restriction protein A